MPNIFWYYGVTVVGMGMIVFTLLRNKSIATISLVSFLLLGTLTIGEFTVLTVFNAYAYRPGVFTDYFADDVIGYVLGNYFVWAGSANLVVNFSLGTRWIILLSGFFMLIETLFLHLGIYEQHWWKTYMTGIVVFAGLQLIKIWLAAFHEKSPQALQYTTFYLIALVLIHVPTHLLLLLGKQHYSIGWAENFYRDSILFGLPYNGVMAVMYVFFGHIVRSRFGKLLPIVIFVANDMFLVNLGRLVFEDHWNFFYHTILLIMSYAIFIWYKEYICREFGLKERT